MWSRTVVRGCDNGKKTEVASHVPVVEFVLMDGSYTCFVARLNSGIVKKLLGSEPLLGSTVTVKDHAFIWPWNKELVEWRTVVFAKDFEHERPPYTSGYKAADDVESFSCPDFIKDRFDVEAIDAVMASRRIVPFNYIMENSGNWHWGALHCKGVHRGFFIQSKETTVKLFGRK